MKNELWCWSWLSLPLSGWSGGEGQGLSLAEPTNPEETAQMQNIARAKHMFPVFFNNTNMPLMYSEQQNRAQIGREMMRASGDSQPRGKQQNNRQPFECFLCATAKAKAKSFVVCPSSESVDWMEWSKACRLVHFQQRSFFQQINIFDPHFFNLSQQQQPLSCLDVARAVRDLERVVPSAIARSSATTSRV